MIGELYVDSFNKQPCRMVNIQKKCPDNTLFITGQGYRRTACLAQPDCAFLTNTDHPEWCIGLDGPVGKCNACLIENDLTFNATKGMFTSIRYVKKGYNCVQFDDTLVAGACKQVNFQPDVGKPCTTHRQCRSMKVYTTERGVENLEGYCFSCYQCLENFQARPQIEQEELCPGCIHKWKRHPDGRQGGHTSYSATDSTHCNLVKFCEHAIAAPIARFNSTATDRHCPPWASPCQGLAHIVRYPRGRGARCHEPRGNVRPLEECARKCTQVCPTWAPFSGKIGNTRCNNGTSCVCDHIERHDSETLGAGKPRFETYHITADSVDCEELDEEGEPSCGRWRVNSDTPASRDNGYKIPVERLSEVCKHGLMMTTKHDYPGRNPGIAWDCCGAFNEACDADETPEASWTWEDGLPCQDTNGVKVRDYHFEGAGNTGKFVTECGENRCCYCVDPYCGETPGWSRAASGWHSGAMLAGMLVMLWQ